MRKITFTNSRGESIQLDYSPFLISKINGISEAPSQIQTSNAPFQDGSTYVDSVLEPRPIAIEGAFTSLDKNEVNQQRLLMQRIFNPKLGEGILQYENESGIKEIKAVADGTPIFPDKERDPFQRFLINVLCPNPYWRDPQRVSRALQAYKGGFSFPFSFPVSFGTTNDYTILTNDGHVPTPVTIDIQGPVVNPKITNHTTGELIQINQSISTNEILHIDTNPKAKRVELIRDGLPIKNVMGWVEYAISDFWMLEPGENSIGYVADAGDNDAIVAVAWHNLYAGI
jgi:hypothetical protein